MAENVVSVNLSMKGAAVVVWDGRDKPAFTDEMTLRTGRDVDTMTILIAGDDPDMRTFLRLGLEEAGYTIEETNLQQAVRSAKAGDHRLAIVDLGKSAEKDLRIIDELSHENSAMKIIAIAGGSRAVNKLYVGDVVGVVRTFWKPFELGDLLSSVQDELRHDQNGEHEVT